MASASSHLPLGRLLILSIAMIYRTWQRLGVDFLYDLPLAKMKLSVHQHTSAKEREGYGGPRDVTSLSLSLKA